MSSWKSRLSILGAAAAGVLAAKTLRILYLWAELGLGPVRVRRFKSDWAVVTGGSEGVGKAVATHLAKHGLNVVLLSRSQRKLEAAAAGIKRLYPAVQVQTIAADVSDPSHLKRVQQLLPAYSPISVLVCSVGADVPGFKPYWQHSEDEEQKSRAINGDSYYNMIKAVLPGMIERGKGAVVAVSSIASRNAAYFVPYGAEKAKMNATMAALDIELQESGLGGKVTSQAMVLGGVITPAAAKFLAPASPRNIAASQASCRTAISLDSGATAAAGAPGGSSNESESAEAAMARIRPSITLCTSDTVGAAIVRAIGKGGPVMTPYWGHALFEHLMFDTLWPPALQRAASRFVARYMQAKWEQAVPS